MSTYSAHKGGSGAYVGLDPAHAHAHAHAKHVLLELVVVAGHLELEGVGGHPQPEGVGVEEEVVAGHFQVLGHLFPILDQRNKQ